MKRLKYFRVLMVIACFVSCKQPLLAQKDKLTASVNAAKIGLNDELEITFTINSQTPEIYSFTKPLYWHECSDRITRVYTNQPVCDRNSMNQS